MHTHKIDKYLHQDFLEEKRKDPITGDLIEVDSEIVFCARCKSAFFRESWEFMDRRHCGQNQTLRNFPISRELLLNAPIINPAFITPLSSSYSVAEWNKHLKIFEVEEKKAVIHLKSTFLESWQASKRMIQSPFSTSHFEEIKKKTSKIKSITNPIGESKNIFTFFDEYPIGFIFTLFTIAFAAYSFIFYEMSVLVLAILGTIWIGLAITFINQFYKFKLQNVGSRKKISIFSSNVLVDSYEEVKSYNLSTLFGIVENKFFLYNEKNNFLSFCFHEKKITITYKSEKRLLLEIQAPNEEKQMFMLVFFSKQRMTKFLSTLAKQKKRFDDKNKVSLLHFPANQEKHIKRKLGTHKEFVFVRPTPKVAQKEQLKDNSNKEEGIINPVDLTKLKKSQKVSKQSQNRNRHHQNRQQAQYRNYKRR
ncbi:hypothetical protein [Bernardetia sp.]|uniref:hypothetical protein n=1 Tax=Bernardetia sp. TaxID=1937974 RepID=UPI0025BE63F1|nr:hypothetical protein [Bernardetia sp.]